MLFGGNRNKMLKTIITSAITYSSTAIDLLIILMFFFAKIKDKKGMVNFKYKLAT